MSITTRGTRVALLALALAACGDDGGGSGPIDAGPDAGDAALPPDAADDLVAVATVPAELNRALDLLLVIDNSGSMGEEQQSIAANLPQLINVLNTAPGGLPDVHIGVVSTNVGTGGVNIGGCSTATRPQGDDGNLLTSGCPGLTAAYVEDLRSPDGSRARNYSGDLATVLSCMTRLGTAGCGFEQPLESMKRALSPGRNPGFLRANALLGVLIVTDEDDCSAFDGGAMFGDPNGTISSPLGPRTSFRCFEFGVQCAGDTNPRAFGTKTGCVPRPASTYMPSVQPYVDFLRGLKADPKQVVVSTIAGNVDDQRTAVVGADPDDTTRPILQPSCQSASGIAAPALRLRTFLDGFPERNAASTICNDNLADALDVFGHLVRAAQGDACIQATLADVDPAAPGIQVRCEVTQYTLVGGVRTDPVALPACGAGGPPCWQLAADPTLCPTAPSNQALEIVRPGPAPAGSVVEARCQVEP
ncbi:MAG: VWA domain-containing protein [Myxococcales bacterium]|nr:VWA domain-containing protein [Myxococcales bacterium]